MWPFRKKEPNRSPGTKYIMKFMAHDRFTLAEFYDDAFTETLIDIRRENGRFFLEKTSHHHNAKVADTKRMALAPFNTFDGFFAQLERFCSEFLLNKALLQKDYRLMCFLSLYKFIFLLGSDNGAEFVDGNIIIIEGIPHVIRKGADPIPTTWEDVKQRAINARPSTGLWIRDLNESNWEAYTFELYSWWQPIKPRRTTAWYFRDTRDESSIWKDYVINLIVRDRETGAYYLSHEVADGYSADHYPRWIYNHIPISAQEVAQLEAAGLLEPGPDF